MEGLLFPVFRELTPHTARLYAPEIVSAESELKQTPLHAEHEKLGGRMVDFSGWSMPVQYSGIVDEHTAVRESLGVFDISHMGELVVSGSGGRAWLNRMLTNNLERLDVGEGQYTFLLNNDGGVIDDLIVYRTGEDTFLMVVNAAMIETDAVWLSERLDEGVTFENQSDQFAGLAVQGPNAARLFDRFFGEDRSRPSRNEIRPIACEGQTYHIARTGYTGEDGFEIFFPASEAVAIWNRILEKGSDFGIKPCGLGARDTLRLEMCYPLNGSDLSPRHTPIEAGLSIFVDLTKDEFIGRGALLRQKEEGIARRLVPFKMDENCPPPRAHYPVMKDGNRISEVNSGTLSPSLRCGIGMTYLPVDLARINEQIEIEIRGRTFPATVQKKPFYTKKR